MAELKTKKTDEDPAAFVERLEDPTRREECRLLLKLMEEATGSKPRVWGSSIIGFGDYKYKSGKTVNEWFITGFSSRKQNLTIYMMGGFKGYDDLMNRLGKHKTGGSCLYLKTLDDVDSSVLRELIEKSARDFKAKYVPK